MIGRGDKPIEVTVSSPLPGELERYRALLAANDLDGLVARYPVRHSQALARIATALRCPDRPHYERAALRAIDTNAELKGALRARLGSLSAALS